MDFFHGLRKGFSRLDIGCSCVPVLRYFLAVAVRKQRDELFFFREAQAEGQVAPVLPGGESAGGKEEISHFGPGSPGRFSLTMGSKSFVLGVIKPHRKTHLLCCS